jgi:hypothetical protein
MSRAEAPAVPTTGGLSLLRRAADVLVALPRSVALFVALAWAGGIWWLSSTSMPPGDPSFTWSAIANLAHAPLFGLLALWLIAALPRRASLGRRPWPALELGPALLVLLAVGAYGCVDEWHQSWTEGRDASFADIVTDLVGAAGVLLVARYVAQHAANEVGLRLRLLAAAATCVAAAVLATVTS